MKSMLVAAAAMLAFIGLSSGPSEAAGCVKGAVIGGIAGHFVGHGLLGAGADPTKPYVMWPGTQYEHLMLPVR